MYKFGQKITVKGSKPPKGSKIVELEPGQEVEYHVGLLWPKHRKKKISP